MTIHYQHLMKLTPNQIHNHLIKRGLPMETIHAIKDTIAEQKEDKRAAMISKARLREQWQPLLYGLRAERESLRSSIKHHNRVVLNGSTPATEPKGAAIQAYDVVLAKLQEKLTSIKNSKQTPGQAAKQKNIPNGGTHWVDWVPAHIKERVIALYAAIPHVRHSKPKIPFKRTAKSNAEQTARLKARTLAELETLQRALSAAPQDPRLNKRVSKITHALVQIDQLKPDDPVPRTWHGLKNY